MNFKCDLHGFLYKNNSYVIEFNNGTFYTKSGTKITKEMADKYSPEELETIDRVSHTFRFDRLHSNFVSNILSRAASRKPFVNKPSFRSLYIPNVIRRMFLP